MREKDRGQQKSSSREAQHPPYTLSVKGAAQYFGIEPKTFYNLINQGKLLRGKHYLKMGRKVLIVRQALIEYLHTGDGSNLLREK